MFTSYLSTRNYIGLSATYQFDSQVDFLCKKISIDGRLSTSFSPLFSGSNDFYKNNYSLLFLTKPVKLSDVTVFQEPKNNVRQYFCNVYNYLSGSGQAEFLRFSGRIDDNLQYTLIYDHTFTGRISSVNDLFYFNFDLTDPFTCTLAHNFANQDYFLSFNPTNLNLNFVILSGFSSSTEYNRRFFYTYNKEDNSLTLQVRAAGQAWQVIRDNNTRRLALCAVDSISFTDTRGIFYLTAFAPPKVPKATIDWGSYLRNFNQNNIDIDKEKSFFDIKSNLLVHAEYFNLEKEGLKANFLTLKSQLNTHNLQGRGNVFPDEEPVNYRNYVSIFSGNRQERGFEKLHLQYESYSTPYTFDAGKTTWFHMPQNIYPYDRLNVTSSKLVEAGAIGGDHPLRSDRIYKKLGAYKYTSNEGDSTGETTGQWLCSWLSAAPDISIKPVWVDRYYNSNTVTPYQAITAPQSNVTYKTSFECLDLTPGITDVPSNLTFEPGCLYAYSHIGQIDAQQNIKALSPYLQAKNLTSYQRINGSLLGPTLDSGIFNTYSFIGNNYGTIDITSFKPSENVFTVTFWASRTDWTVPIGYQIAGNYNEYGMGIYNYQLVTPQLFFLCQGNIITYNSDLEPINNYNSLQTFNQKAVYYIRRDPLNSFHVITDSRTIAEINLQEAIVDSVSGLLTNMAAYMPGENPENFRPESLPIIDVSNDTDYAYILLGDNSIRELNLTSNLMFKVSATAFVTESGQYKQIRRVGDQLALIDGNQSVVRGTRVYFLSSGQIQFWDTQTKIITGFVGNNNNKFDCFNIDKFDNAWTAKGNTISVYGEYQKLLFTKTLSATSTQSKIPLKIQNITYMENFKAGNLHSDVIIAASGSQLNKLLLTKLDYSGNVIKSVLIDADSTFNTNSDPSNHNYNYAYIYNKSFGNNNYSFKIRLYNQLNTEDLEIPEPIILAKDLSTGYHHFAIVVNAIEGYAKVYLDGSLYNTVPFTPRKYCYTPLLTEKILVGTCPFYSGISFSNFLNSKKINDYYFVKDLTLQNLYFYNKELNYFDINMHFKEKISPQKLVWDVPSGRRNFIDTVSRYFTQRIPGAKSTLYNIYINDNLMDQQCKDYIQTAIIKKISDIAPAYTKLNKLSWVTNQPAVSGEFLQPYFPGNTLTNAGLAP